MGGPLPAPQLARAAGTGSDRCVVGTRHQCRRHRRGRLQMNPKKTLTNFGTSNKCPSTWYSLSTRSKFLVGIRCCPRDDGSVKRPSLHYGPKSYYSSRYSGFWRSACAHFHRIAPAARFLLIPPSRQLEPPPSCHGQTQQPNRRRFAPGRAPMASPGAGARQLTALWRGPGCRA
jgi:hypothetical protein